MADSVHTPAIRSLCVFCGASLGRRQEYREMAMQTGRQLALRGLRLVYGGGGLGLMGVMAEAAMAAGGEVIGVMPHFLREREAAPFDLHALHLVDTLQQRKDLMCELADAFLILPGGFGTLDELSEVLTANQLRRIDKPVGLLNVCGFYDSLLAFLRHAEAEGLLRADAHAMLRVGDRLEALLDQILAMA
ncbi:MAG: TIGR00730 family Rossman fold protein [Gammaproteobacteria bacterium]|nr:TIGR00730 family Rossman fold protein [Gammaproteobacteria bacterium]